MKIIQYLLLKLFLLPIFLFANMAKPTVDGSTVSTLFGTNTSIVQHETIAIKLTKDPSEGVYDAQYRVTYTILSDKDQILPLSFIAINLFDMNRVLVNGKSIATKTLSEGSPLPPYVKKTENGNIINFNNNLGHAVLLEHIVEFSAPLKKGTNVIEVNYSALLQYNTYGFVKDFTLDYAIYPARYWKKFGPIDIELDLGDSTRIVESNIGSPKMKGNIAQWQINDLTNDNITIKITEKRTFIQDTVLFIGPLGFGIIAILILGYFNFKIWIKTRYKSVFWVGIFLVPILYLVVYMFSFNCIDFVLNQSSSRHGYVFFMIFLYPVIVPIYALALHIMKYLKTSFLSKKI